MTKTIKTLEQDINHVLRTGEGWTGEISEWVASDIAKSLNRQFNRGSGRSKTLRVSNLGTPCERKLWYTVNSSSDPESLSPHTLNKFIFGDITESYILGLVKAAGHTVEGLQDTVDVCGIRGSRDCVIDGVLFDVKSASSRAFLKFKHGRLRSDDPFGYISQLSSYLYGSQHDDIVVDKNRAGFLAFDKQFGHIAVDVYDLTEELKIKKEEVEQKKAVVKLKTPPPRPKWERQEYDRKTKSYKTVEVAEDWEYQKSGNRKLSTFCGYCEWKHTCWPEVRTFVSSGEPLYLTKVEREPTGNSIEVTK